MLHLFEHILNPLLGMSLTAAFVAVVVILLRLVLKKRAPTQVVCLLWLVVFARLLIPVMVQSPISLVPTALEDIVQTEQTEEPSQPVETPDPGYTEDIPVNTPVIPETHTPGNAVTTPSAPVVSQPVTGTTQEPMVTPPVTETPPVLEGPSEPETPTEEPPAAEEPAAPIWPAVLSVVWLVGVAVMLVVGVGSYAKLRRRVFDAIRTADGVWEHPSLASPFILGLIRPKIYLPMGIEGQPRQFILHHERAHLRRLDHVVKPICWLALAIHWFNPLAWVAFLLMSRDIEAACDENVIRQLGNEVKADYSATLLALATDKRFPAPSPLSFGEGDAKVRIKNVLNFKKPALWVTIAAVVVAVIAALCLLTDPVDRFDPGGYTTLDYYPGLYFEENTDEKTGITTTKAYRLEDDELVLVAGWMDHPANNFGTLIHPDGREEVTLAATWEIVAQYEQYLVDCMMEQDEDWAKTYLTTVSNLSSTDPSLAPPLSDVHGEAALTPEKNVLLYWNNTVQVFPLQTSITEDALFHDIRFHMEDTDGFNGISLCWTGGRTVWLPSDPEHLFFAGDALITYTWDGEMWTAHDSEYDVTTAAVPVNFDTAGQQIHVFKHDDSRDTLTFSVPAELGKVTSLYPSGCAKIARRADGDYDLTYGVFAMPEGKNSDKDWVHVLDVFAIMKWNNLTEEYEITFNGAEAVGTEPADDPVDNPADTPMDGPVPISPLGELFLSALNDEVQIVDPGLGKTGTLGELLKATTPAVKLRISRVSAVDLDSDGVKEFLLGLETAPDAPYGTMILYYSNADGKVYGYSLWARAFMDVKTDGTFTYSGGAATNGVARITFSPEGYERDILLHQDFDLDLDGATNDYYYYKNGEPTTEQEFYDAFAAWWDSPGIVWMEYTPENVRILLGTQFPVGSTAAMTVIGSLPEEEVWLCTDADGSFWLDAYGHFGPVTILNDLKANVNPSTVAELRKSMVTNLSGPDFETIYFTMKDKGGTTPISYSLLWNEDQGVWDTNPYQTTLSSLPRDIVTSETYPADPEWYYKVAGTDHYDLYARNHGAEVMLTYGNFFWNFTHTAHTGRMNLPVMKELDNETVAVISEVNSGTGVSVKKLVVYDTTLPVATDYLYDWSAVTDAFNDSNTLVYDADTNSLILLWNGTAYFTGTLTEDLAHSQALEDGWTGKLLASGDIINFTHNGGSSFTVTVETAIAGRPTSIGAAGFVLTWNVEFTGEGFAASAPAIQVSSKENPYLKAAFPAENLYLFALGNGGEYYYLVEGGQVHKVPGAGILTDYDLECQLVDLDHDGQMEIAMVGNHYAGSSSFGVLNVFDKDADGWVHRRLTSYYSSEAIDYVSQYDGITMFDEAVFTPGSDPTQVNMRLGGFDLALTVTDEMAARNGDYYVSGTSRSIIWDGDAYYLHLHGSIHRRGGQYHWPSDDCGVTFRYVCRLTYRTDGTFSQTPVGLVQTYDIPNQTLAAATKDFYVIRNDGSLIMWGSPEGTLTGSGLSNVPVESPVELMKAYYGAGFPVFVDAGIYGGVMVVDTMGALYAHGIWADPNAPTQPVWLLGGVSMVSCGQFDTYVLREDGTLWSYGHNSTGLSTLNTMMVNGVTWYKLLDGVLFVEAGGYSSGYAILTDHTLWAWNQTGELVKVADNAAFCCDGRIIDRSGNLLDGNGGVLLTDVKYANSHYAVKQDGTLWALTDPDPNTLWGTGTPLEEPVFITDGVSEIASGEFESILLKTDGSLWKLSADGTMTDITVALR